MRILAIGDPHYKVKNSELTDLFELEVEKHLRAIKFDFIVILGDVLDTHERMHTFARTRAVKWIQSVAKYAPCYVLIGNHDRINNSVFLTDEHPFVGMEAEENITIVWTTLQKEISGESFTFVPYVPNGRFHEALSQVGEQWKDSAIIFAHQEFRGVEMGRTISSTGDVWDKSDPMVISGHIHEQCSLQPNLIYVGTPYQESYGEVKDKRLLQIELETEEMKFTDLLLSMPRKATVELEANEFEDYPFPKEQIHLRLRITGSKAEIELLSKHEKISKWKKLGHKVELIKRYEIPALPSRIEQRGFRSSLKALAEEKDLTDAYEYVFG